MRSSAAAFVLLVMLSATPSYGQETPQELTAQQDPQKTPPEQKPPAAVGEAGKKPTRGFAKALFYNLGDVVKHMPRRNSLYWLAGGGAVALLIHPEDGKINRRL